MRLKCVIIDGFKSYAHRQVLEDLDPHFNAITGLNGSGKSNIFDALCFVMGISNLKRVRAEETRDLIYKNGNAGIQTATVTIECINDDPATAPHGYPPDRFPIIRISRSLAVGGRQKFYLNERMADSSKVKQFFQNALLNVDNPHFMVLQGTVHKMVSMRSSEVLGLLEEASGTRVFDTRRRAAENLLRSKEKRVQSISDAIEEMHPKVEAMRVEKENFAKFQLAKEELTQKSKFVTAYNYWTLQREVEAHKARVNSLEEDVRARKNLLAELPLLQSEAKQAVVSIEEQMKDPLQTVEKLRAKEQELTMNDARARTLLTAAEKAIRGLEAEIKKIEKERNTAERSLADFNSETEKILETYEKTEEDLRNSEERIVKLKESLRLHRSGVQATESGLSARDEFETLNRRLIAIAGEKRRHVEQLTVLESELTRRRSEMERSNAAAGALQNRILNAQIEFEKAEKCFAPYREDFDKLSQLRSSLRELKAKYANLMEGILAQSHVCAPLQYTQIPGMDLESHIYGRVGELVTPKDSKYSKALTAGTGYMLLDRVVVSRDDIAQTLIEKGRLRTRTSFLPLNTIVPSPHVIDSTRLQAAKDIASRTDGGFVISAVDLVQFDPMLKTVALNTYGTFVVCSDLSLAQRLAGHPSTKMKAVTVGGDVADAQGIVTGGSNKNIRDFVLEFAAAAERKVPLTALKEEITVTEKRTAQVDHRCSEAQPLFTAFCQAESSLQGLKQQLSDCAGNSAVLLQAAERSATEARTAVERLENEAVQIKQKLKDLEAFLISDPSKVEAQLVSQLAEEERRAARLRRATTEGETRTDSMRGEKSLREQRIVDLQQEIAANEKDIREKRQEKENLSVKIKEFGSELEILKARITEEEKKSASLQKELEERQCEVVSLAKREQDTARFIKNSETDIRVEKRAIENKMPKVEAARAEHPWICTEELGSHQEGDDSIEEKVGFGNPSGPYYFEDHERTERTLAEIQELMAILKASEGNVNERASLNYEEYSANLKQLISQKETLMYDREIILKTISLVEARKWSALDKMFHIVNEVFGKLYSTCLSGASARLVEERDQDTGRLLGLNVKVSFNARERESLTELSGGQRSLLSLCLILSILRAHPAPFYILDEVDAALDPSHTQNIGRMLQQHFSGSQFLLVSLKDGMFKNANVLYEIRNTLGYSQVTRSTASGIKKH